MAAATHPTVVPAKNFNALADAEALQTAMKGFGCDEKPIVAILTHRSATQRLEIAKAYKTAYGKDLIERLKSELSGHFEEVVLALMMERAQYEATCLRKAMKGVGTADHVLIEILCTRTNAEIAAIKAAYTALFHRDLEKDVESETSGHFRRVLVSAVQGARPETGVDAAAAKADAKKLYEAGEGHWGTDESAFNLIFMTRSYAQLRAIFHEYEALKKKGILHAIESEMGGDLKKSFIALAESALDRPGFFAEHLYASMKGLGTSDDDLIRLIVTRSEVDMVEIKERFQAKFGKSLGHMIEGDCSGHYKHALLGLIGDQ